MGKPNKSKGRNPKGHECNPAMARDGALSHFPSLLTCCFANSIYQSLNWRSLHSCVTASLGKSLLSWLGQLILYNCPCWSCSCLAAPFSVGWMLAEGAQCWTMQRPWSSPSNTEWLSAWPWETAVSFCIWFLYLPHRNAGEISQHLYLTQKR